MIITLDTVRADRIAAYGYDKVETPWIDSLARKGVAFRRCISPVPLTLPAHASIFTGTYPTFHGVRDNAGFRLPPQIPTLAEQFKAGGYVTAAFVGSFILGAESGLARGFDEYGDRFASAPAAATMADVQRPANEVVDDALAWLGERAHPPFFLWVHLYDPHAPYEAPSPFRERYASDPYAGEIAFADSQIGRMLSFLDRKGLAKSTWIVFVGDHGEALGDHGELEHGFFVYQETLRVPLIIVSPAGARLGVWQEETVSAADLAPTILEELGLPRPASIQGKSLVPLLEGRPDAPRLVYAETLYPRLHFGWSRLRSIQDARYKLILSPEPELYDLYRDPAEQSNVLKSDPRAYGSLQARAVPFIREIEKTVTEPATREVDPETAAKLASLGYLSRSAGSDPGADSRPSPRGKIGLYNQVLSATRLAIAHDFARAEAGFRNVLKQDPEVIDAYAGLGNIFFEQKRFEEAVGFYREVLRRQPADSGAAFSLATSLLALSRQQEAVEVLRGSEATGHADARVLRLFAELSLAQGTLREAQRLYERLRAADPRSAAASSGLAAALLASGDLAGAEVQNSEALRLDPRSADALDVEGQIFGKKGDFENAAKAWQKELEIAPESFRACYNLAYAYRQLGQDEREESYLRKAVAIEPANPRPYFYLARLLIARGEYSSASAAIEKGLSAKPGPADQSFGFLLLADLYKRTGKPELAQKYEERGRALLKQTSPK